MAQSFTTTRPQIPAPSERRKILVTGAAGNIGSYFAEHSHHKYDLRLMVQKLEDGEKIKEYGELVAADLADLERLKELCAGVDTVLHLAGNPKPDALWNSIIEDNITGTYHTFVAAKAAFCRRVIYASSIHAVSGYPKDVQVKTNEPVNPGDLYGVSKCFGEAMGRYMSEKEGLSVIALRIGAFQPEEAAEKPGLGMADCWVSQRDLNQLIERSIDNDHVRFAILHGLSNNRLKRLDISDTRELVAYEPEDDFTEINPLLKDLHFNETIDSSSAITDGHPSGLRDDLKAVAQ